MKKVVYVSLVAASALAMSANAVEVNPFGHLGAFYHQGFGGLPTTDKNGKEVQRAYADVSARVGIELGLSQSLSVGLGGWGAYPFYTTGHQNNYVGDIAIPKNGDVSDAYLRYDGGSLSFILGRFDMGQFYLGKDGKNYTGVDWIYGNVQGAALNVGSKAVSFWAYWRNSQLGAGQAYNRMGYELSSFNTYQNYKSSTKIGELVSAGLDFDFGMLKVSPFVAYLTDMNTSIDTTKNSLGTDDILNAGAKAQLELGSGNLKSITTLRGIYGTNNIVGKGKNTNGVTFWVDEELRFNDIWKLGAGYVSQNKDAHLLNFGDRARFYGYRGGLSGAGYGAYLGGSGLNNHSTWYVFGGVEAKRVALDLLYAGGDYEELSAVGSVKLWTNSDNMYFSVGAGYVGTGKGSPFYNAVSNDKWQHSALAFAKFGF
ncbi:hypothetical protein [Helicobacter typhlonius]|uniref:hypothetical protein n=1 Tax=Helicobacter typhlonius TaxID=76936 RepID=UPI002FE0D842